MKHRRACRLCGVALFTLWACEQLGGAAAAHRELAVLYGEDRVQVDLRRHDGATKVEVRIADPSSGSSGPLGVQTKRARQVAEVVARHVPLEADGDTVAVTFVSENRGGVVDVRRNATFRFSVSDLSQYPRSEPASP